MKHRRVNRQESFGVPLFFSVFCPCSIRGYFFRLGADTFLAEANEKVVRLAASQIRAQAQRQMIEGAVGHVSGDALPFP
jgi:hypothetical protein